ncbi:MAG: sulfite exporter TauE/SafE family protein [Nanoarchaeota archaeon]|nr:sulfite exporter TauE/SafE family protein [Nanoarchaeota archaeon]
MFFEILVLLFAGWGAGIVTGLIGASAVMFAAPVMVLFLGFDAYTAIGISLGIDVVASIIATFIFHKNKNIRLKPGIVMAFFAVIGAFLGSYFSSYMPPGILIKITGVAIFLTGLRLYRQSLAIEANKIEEAIKLRFSKKQKVLLYGFAGFIVGVIGGVFGAGGGLSILFVLTFVSKYKIHTAVGTSVFVMTFLALSGAVGHYIYGSFVVYAVVIGAVGAIIGSFSSAVFANWVSEKTLNKTAAIIFIVLGVTMAIREFLL